MTRIPFSPELDDGGGGDDYVFSDFADAGFRGLFSDTGEPADGASGDFYTAFDHLNENDPLTWYEWDTATMAYAVVADPTTLITGYVFFGVLESDERLASAIKGNGITLDGASRYLFVRGTSLADIVLREVANAPSMARAQRLLSEHPADSVSHVWLADNRIAELPRAAFSRFPKLRQMDLLQNRIEDLSDGVFEGISSSMRAMLFGGNPNFFSCPPGEITTRNGEPCPWILKVTQRLHQNGFFLRTETAAPTDLQFQLYVSSGEFAHLDGDPAERRSVVTIPAGEYESERIQVTKKPSQEFVQVQFVPVQEDLVFGLPYYPRSTVLPLTFFGGGPRVISIPTVRQRVPSAVYLLLSTELSGDDRDLRLNLSEFFGPPLGGRVRFEAELDDTTKLDMDLTGSTLTLTPKAAGEAELNFRAWGFSSTNDSSYLDDEFVVQVRESVASDFDITIIQPGQTLTPAMTDAVNEGVRRWSSILRDVPDSSPDLSMVGEADCYGRQYGRIQVDDAVIFVVLRNIDGPGGTLAFAGPCTAHTVDRNGQTFLLPTVGTVTFDIADMGSESFTDPQRIATVVHELGHTLGFGILGGGLEWGKLTTHPNPFDPTYLGGESYFEGKLATVYFDSAAYTPANRFVPFRGRKVPVEPGNRSGSSGSHWNEAVMQSELMTPRLGDVQITPFSAITASAMYDMGFTLSDAWRSQVDFYRLPFADIGLAGAKADEEGDWIDLSNDVRRSPIAVFDKDGNFIGKVDPNR